MEVEIQRLEEAVLILAKAIEDGRIDELYKEISQILKYNQ
jgi:hypothetical protein